MVRRPSTAREIACLEYLRQRGDVTIAEIEEALGLTRHEARRVVATLSGGRYVEVRRVVRIRTRPRTRKGADPSPESP